MAAPPVEIPSLRAFIGAIALKITTAVTTNLGLYKLQGGLTANDIDVRNVVNGCVDAVDALSTAGGAPSDASYLCLGANLTLTSERVATAGSAITITDAGAGSTCTFAVSTGGIVNSHVNAAAAIAGTKVAPAFGSQNISTTGTCVVGALTCDTATIGTFGTGVVHSNGSGVLSSSLLVNADVDAAAAIAGTKIAPDFGAQNVVTTGSVSGDELSATTSVDTAAILCSGLAQVGSAKITGLTTGVAHLDADGDVTSSLIVNADVNAAAAIAGTKISPDFGAQNITTTGSISAGANSIGTSGNVLAGTVVVSSGNKLCSTSVVTFSTTTTSESTVDAATTTDRDYVVNVQCIAKKTDETARAEQVMSARFKNVAGTLTRWGNGGAVAKTTLESDGTVTDLAFDVRVSTTNIRFGFTPSSAGNWECTMIVEITVVD